MAIQALGFPHRKLEPAEIRRALDGRHDTITAHGALHAVWRDTDDPRRARLLKAVLVDRERPPLVRQAAALYLGKIGRPGAVEALRGELGEEEAGVRGAIFRGLGRTGDRAALDLVGRLRPRLRGRVAREASFAITLLAYRHGVPGHEVRWPRGRPLVPGSRRFRGLELRPASARERTAIADSQRLEALGMEVATERAYRLVCGPRQMAVVFERALVDETSPSGRLAGPTLAAQVLHWHEHDQAFAPIFYILSHPAGRGRGSLRVSVLNSGGRLCCVGSGSLDGDAVEFDLRGIEAPGNTPVHVGGSFDRGGVELSTARVGLAVPRARRAKVRRPVRRV